VLPIPLSILVIPENNQDALVSKLLLGEQHHQNGKKFKNLLINCKI
jgi:hypothetical protein